jgi:hypothetical protein
LWQIQVTDNILISVNNTQERKMSETAILTAHAISGDEGSTEENKVGVLFTEIEFARLLFTSLGSGVVDSAILVTGPTGGPAVLLEHSAIGIDTGDADDMTGGEFVEAIGSLPLPAGNEEVFGNFIDFVKGSTIVAQKKSKNVLGIVYSLVKEIEVEENDA